MLSEDDIGVLILHGLGVEGQAALPWFLERSPCRIIAIDTVEKTAALPAAIKENERLTLTGEKDFSLPVARNTLYLRSPGIPPVNPVFTAVREAGIRHTTPTGYWIARHAPAGTITITGTKGKSTTTSLTANLLRWGGIAAEEMGNIGRTPFEAAPPPGAICVFELSSYMMHDLPQADIFHVVTSLYKEHTDWHGSMAAYAADKLRPFSFTPPAPGLISRELDPHLKTRPDSVRYMGDFAAIENGAIRIGDGPVLHPAELNDAFAAPSMALALRAAIAICLSRGLLAPDQVHRALMENLHSWHGLQSRQQPVATADGKLWIDDALATVPEATLSALARWSREPVHLILGGKDRGQDFTALLDACKAHQPIRLYLFDETGSAIHPLATERKLESGLFNGLEEAIAAAAKASKPGEIILFSPAAPSSSVHGNYRVRSAIFQKIAGSAA